MWRRVATGFLQIAATLARGGNLPLPPSACSLQVVALDGLSFDVRRRAVTALLGHNGAGKTTAIHVLTGAPPSRPFVTRSPAASKASSFWGAHCGAPILPLTTRPRRRAPPAARPPPGMLQPSGGAAAVEGLDAATQMAAIRRSLGVCPQFDILWPHLTVGEHLETYWALKGGAGGAAGGRGVAEEAAAEVRAAAGPPWRARPVMLPLPAISRAAAQRRKARLSLSFENPIQPCAGRPARQAAHAGVRAVWRPAAQAERRHRLPAGPGGGCPWRRGRGVGAFACLTPTDAHTWAAAAAAILRRIRNPLRCCPRAPVA